MVDVRLDTLPQELPWSTISRRLVCKECGALAMMGRFAPEAVMPFSFEVMGTRGRLTDYHLSAKNSRGGPAETDL
jgi:hypothetical protein